MQTTSVHCPSISSMLPTARCFLLPVHGTQPRVVSVPCRAAPALTALSARARRGARRDRSWDDDGSSGGDEDAIDESFFGEPRDDEEEPDDEPEEERRRRRPASPEDSAGQLRGSDVLRALQRAAAAKEAKKMVKKKKHQQSAGARPAAWRQGKPGGGGGTPVQVVVGEVRPIQIRHEWAPRIRELELRAQQLLDKYHQ